jgi:hypothetical protein
MMISSINCACRLLFVSMLFVAFSSVGYSFSRQSAIITPGIPTPESHFGFTPGEDRKLFDYEEKEEFSLPVSNIGNRLSDQGLDVTGSLLRVRLRHDHPLTLGL